MGEPTTESHFACHALNVLVACTENLFFLLKFWTKKNPLVCHPPFSVYLTFISKPNHPIRTYYLNPTKSDKYALRPAAPKPLFVRAMEYFGKLQIDTRKIESSITNYAQSDEAQATKDSKLKLFTFSTKNTNITVKYTQTDREKTKRSDT
jgi:hypothetical protein